MDKSSKFGETLKEKSVQDFSTASIEEEEGVLTTGGFKGWVRRALLTVETRGIQRVTDEERQHNPTKVWNACTFWSVLFAEVE